MVLRRYVFILRSPLKDRSAEHEVAGITASTRATFQNTVQIVKPHSLDKICSSLKFHEISFRRHRLRFLYELYKYFLFIFKKIDVNAVVPRNNLEAVFI